MSLFEQAARITRRAVRRAKKRRQLFGRIGLVTAITAGLVASGANMAQASTAIDLVLTDSSGATVTAVTSGAVVNLTATLPVVDAASRTQEVVQQLDPTKLKLSSAADVVYPSGWTLSVCTASCETPPLNFTTTLPTTTAGWNAVRAVRAVGLVQGSDGQGGQIAQSSATQTTPLSSSFTSAAQGSGDGWILGFDDRGNVFNIFHHDGKNNVDQGGVDCHTRAGAACAGTWPLMLKDWGLHTADQPYFYVNNVNHHLYFHTTYVNPSNTNTRNSGIACIDLSTISAAGLCGGSMATGYEALGGATLNYLGKGNMKFAQVGNLLYTIDQVTSKLQCLDMLGDGGYGKACTGSMFSVVPSGQQAYWDSTTLRSIGGKVYGSSNQYGFCFDPATNAACTGWETNKTFTYAAYRIIDLPDASGNHAAVCYISGFDGANGGTAGRPARGTCFTDAGASYATPAWIDGYFSQNQGDWYITYAVNNPETYGTRVYWNKNVRNPWSYYCYDVKTNAACANFPITSSPAISGYSSYTLVLDPDNPNCLWTTNDANMIQAYDATTGTSGCSTTPRSVVTFSGAVSAPRMGCDPATSAITAWSQVALTAPATNTYTTVKLTVKDSLGLPITGFTGLAPTSTTAGGFPSFNLSALTTAVSGQNPSFQFTFAGLTASQTTSIDVSAVGGAPQMCLRALATAVCPTSVSPGPIPTADLYPSTVVTSTGTSMDSQSVITQLTSSAKTLSININTASCGATINGRTTSKAYGATGTAVPGVLVTLKDASGNAILDSSGNPITTTVAADGTYSFSGLYPGNYTVGFGSVPESAATGVKTNLAATPATITSVTGPTSAVISLAAGATGVANALYLMPDASISGRTTSGTYGTTGTAVTGVLVTLKDASGNPVLNSSGNPITTTVAADGTYSFPNLYPGNYTVSFGAIPTAAASGVQTNLSTTPGTIASATGSTSAVIALPAGVNGVANALYIVPNVSISGRTGTATWGTAGNPVAGVVVKLLNSAGNPVLDANGTAVTTTTAADGTYAFPLQYPGSYIVAFVPPTGVTPTGVKAQWPSGVQQSTAWTQSGAMDLLAGSAAQVYGIFNVSAIAAPDTSVGPINTAQTITVLTNDTASVGATLTPSTVRLCSGTQVAPSCTATTLTTVDGTYTVNTTTGVVTFTPVVGFTGTVAVPVKYQVTDSASKVANSTITPTVYGAPTAVANATSGILNATQTTNILTNDAPGAGTTFNLATLKLCAPSGSTVASNPVLSPNGPNCIVAPGDTISVPGVGTYSVDAAGLITFTPVTGYVGTPTPLTYSITNSQGVSVTSTYTPTVIGAPTATLNTTIGPLNTPQTVNILSNDAAATGTTLVASTVLLCDPNTNPAQTSPNCSVAPGSTITVTGVGTYSVSSAGLITFTPVTGYTGTPAPLNYQVSDALGQKATSTYTPTVYGAPVANPDTTINALDVNQTFNVVTNDTAGAGTSLVASSVKLCNTACTSTSVTVANVGTYTVASTGVITFDPLPTYTGTPAPLTYQVTDDKGQTVTSTYTPTVYGAPVANPNTTSGPMNTAQSTNIFTNDVAGALTTLDVTTIKLCDPNCTATTVTVANVGTYVLNTTTGVITFTPVSGYTGTPAPLAYQVTDNKGQTATSTYTPTVSPAPALTPDAQTSAWNTAQSYTPLSNDRAGSGTTLLASSITLCNPNSNPAQVSPNCTIAAGTPIVVANEGTYLLLNSGVVTFTPLSTFVGTATGIHYTATDVFGQIATTTITPTVLPMVPPVANPDRYSTFAMTPITVNPVVNDVRGSGVLVASTVLLCSPTEAAPTCASTSVAVTEGVFTVETTGQVTFTPNELFDVAHPVVIPYIILDANGLSTHSTITIDDPPLPVVIPQLVNTGLNILGSVPAAVVLIAIGFGFAAVGAKARKKLKPETGSLSESTAFTSLQATLDRVMKYSSPAAATTVETEKLAHADSTEEVLRSPEA